jgi:hypothetical protein
MEMPNYAYPPDPEANNPQWKDVTQECQALFDELLSQAEQLFGPRTHFVPVRITEFDKDFPTISFNNGIAYIRLGRGVGPRVNPTPDEARQLRHQLALELVHLLSVFPGAPMTALEKGAAAYFAEDIGGYNPVDSGAPEIYRKAYEAVKELLDEFGRDAIKELRQPPRSINRISADDIRERYPDCPEDLIDRLTTGGFGG